MKNNFPLRQPKKRLSVYERSTGETLATIPRRADVHVVLGELLQALCAPNVIAQVSVEAGLHLDGDQCLRLSQRLAANYIATVESISRRPCLYKIPDALMVEDASPARPEVVSDLAQILAMLRAGEGS